MSARAIPYVCNHLIRRFRKGSSRKELWVMLSEVSGCYALSSMSILRSPLMLSPIFAQAGRPFQNAFIPINNNFPLGLGELGL
jgi:hypothetical protein